MSKYSDKKRAQAMGTYVRPEDRPQALEDVPSSAPQTDVCEPDADPTTPAVRCEIVSSADSDSVITVPVAPTVYDEFSETGLFVVSFKTKDNRSHAFLAKADRRSDVFTHFKALGVKPYNVYAIESQRTVENLIQCEADIRGEPF